MAILTKQQVLAQIEDVATMDLDQLEDYSVKVSLSDADPKAKYFIYKAIDMRKEELAGVMNARVINGDIDDMEFKQ